jgi:hypothetical protein
MKKIIVSAGLAAFGAAGIQTAMAAASDIISPKAWSVGATLRGFYDDNYAIGTQSKGSVGFEVSPNIQVNIPLRQTDVGLRYIYGLYYYQDRQDIGINPIDQSHQFEVWLDHKFNTRWHLNVSDTLAMGQEPELLQTTASQPFRVKGDNLANHANVTLETQWTKNFNTSVHYGNTLVDYDNQGAVAVADGSIFPVAAGLPVTAPGLNDGNFYRVTPSLSGTLDRIEHSFGLNLNWVLTPVTTFTVGYNFGLVNYLGNEPIAVFNYFDASFAPRSLIYRSDARDSMSHTAFLGLKRQLTPNITGSISAGASYTDNYNDPLNHDTSFSPYGDLNLSYTFVPGSYVQLGVSHNINSTDVVQPSLTTGKITQYQESTVVYADLNHKFTPKLAGTLIGRFQNSQYNGGYSDGSNDQSYGVGINLHYQINQHFSTEVGYNFDDLISGLGGRSYERNRVYLGLTASY